MASILGWICALVAITATADEPDIVDVRVRLHWEAKDVCYWRTQIDFADGSPGPNSVDGVVDRGDSDLAGSIELSDERNGVLIQPRFPKTGGTVECRIRGHRDAKVVISVSRFRPAESSAVDHLPTREVTLAELVAAQTIQSSEDQAVESERPFWSLARLTGDELRIKGLNALTVVTPGQAIKYSVHCNSLLSEASQRRTLKASLVCVDDGAVVRSSRHLMQIDARGNSPSVEVSFAAPDANGVYEVRSSLVREDENIWSRIRRRDIELLNIGQPLIVNDPAVEAVSDESATVSKANETWKTVDEIRPSESTWSVTTWIPQSTSRFIPGSTPSREATPMPREDYAGKTVSLVSKGQSLPIFVPTLGASTPHRITLRLAQDRPIHLQVSPDGSGDLGFVIRQGARSREQSPWLEYRWIHYPSDDEPLVLTNLGAEPTAIESILVEAGPIRLGPTTLTDSKQPSFGMRQAILSVDDELWLERWSHHHKLARGDFDEATVLAQRVWTATQRLSGYAEMSQFTGLTLTKPDRTDETLESHAFDLAMKLLETTRLRVFVAIHPSTLNTELERQLRRRPELVAELTRDEVGRSDQYNLLNETVQQALASWVANLDQRYASHKNFAGLNLHCDQRSHLQPLVGVKNDGIAMEATAGSRDPIRSAITRPEPLTTQSKTALRSLARDKTLLAYQSITLELTERPARLLMPQSDLFDGSLADPNLTQPGATWSIVPIIRYGDPGIIADQMSVQQQISEFSKRANQPVAQVMLGGFRDTSGARNARPHWYTDLTHVFEHLNPNMVLIDEAIVNHHANREPQDLLTAITALPETAMAKFDSPDPATQTVSVRAGNHNGQMIVSITSLVPWPTDVDLETSAPTDWTSSAAALVQTRSQTRVRVTVPAGQMIELHTPSSQSPVRLVGWTSRVNGGIDTLKQIKQQVTSVVERIGVLSDLKATKLPRNGGFEQSGTMGLVGWLHAQHPPGCVLVDDQQHASGNQSIRLTTDPNTSHRTWIVSETIDPPSTGRLSVSLSCRGEPIENAMSHRLKVSIEATRKGRPVHYATEFEVPRSGQWISKHAVLEADGIQQGDVDSLRLTIDSLSAGRVWIDDVRLHEQFATKSERDDLQSLAFLAVQGLQRGNLAPAGRLLRNPWAQHLLSLKHVSKPIPPTDPSPAAEETPGVAERLRTWLPAPLRF